MEWTNEGIMRQPVFLGLREDKSAKEVIREQPGPAPTKETEIKTKANLTHLDKVFWPKEGITKKDVIEYYESIWKWIKPYLLNRPQSLNRHPDGIDGENFFQKDIRHPVPDYVKTEKIFSESENRELNYLVCQNKDTLLYVANLGCIEINTFSSVIQHLKKPDYLILDFDPEEVAFSKVIEIVLAAKKVLDEIKLPGFCKTSGARGIHIYVPLRPTFSYGQVKDFARLIYSVIMIRHPDLTSVERSPSKRKGRVYLDYLQNRFGATMVVPYSLRPKEKAPVSTPLEWSEVTKELNPLDFNIRTIPERLINQGDCWKDLFKQRVDLAKSLALLEKLIKK